MATPPRLTLTLLAHQAAAEIGFTVRRWWRDAGDPLVLRVEVERRLVGAPPSIAVLRVPIPPPREPRRTAPLPTTAPPRVLPARRPKRATVGKRRTIRARTA
jgi:hypothetical protein